MMYIMHGIHIDISYTYKLTSTYGSMRQLILCLNVVFLWLLFFYNSTKRFFFFSNCYIKSLT